RRALAHLFVFGLRRTLSFLFVFGFGGAFTFLFVLALTLGGPIGFGALAFLLVLALGLLFAFLLALFLALFLVLVLTRRQVRVGRVRAAERRVGPHLVLVGHVARVGAVTTAEPQLGRDLSDVLLKIDDQIREIALRPLGLRLHPRQFLGEH